MLLSHLLLGIGWAVYGLLHSLLAAPRIKEIITRNLRISLVQYRLLYILFASLSLVAIVYWECTTISTGVFRESWLTLIAGVAMIFVGMVVMLICVVKYFLLLSGLKNLRAKNLENKLRVSGIHRFVRHPLYLGTFITLWGLFLFVPLASVLISNLMITLYTLLAIPFEEKKLIVEFGDDYLRYQRSVPMILPFFRSHHNH